MCGVCDEGCMGAFACVCESTWCHTNVPVSPGHQYGNNYRPLGGSGGHDRTRVRSLQSCLVQIEEMLE